MIDYCPQKLLEYVRSSLVEQEHLGFLIKLSSDGKISKIGDDKNYPIFLRSCAKPLQAALVVDFGIEEFYNMTSEEIAICCASHAGEPCHTSVVEGFLKKIGLDKSYLKCGLHKPISKTEQNKLLLNAQSEDVLQNNCSGKHSMMLAVCRKMGWSVNDYDSPSHPLQIAIKNKIYDLCEINMLEVKWECAQLPPHQRGRVGVGGYPQTKDGCGVPILAMPLEKMVKGYLNLFLSDKYSKIREAFLQHPYLIGGEDRLDTAIMTANSALISKVGAGGLCIVVNLEKKEGLIVKIMDCDMKARAIVLIEALKQLGWLNEEMLKNELIKAQNKTDILTLHGENIGSAQCTFSLG